MEPLNCEDPAPLGPDPNDDITDDMSELLSKLKLSNMKNATDVPALSSSSAGINAAASEEEDTDDSTDANSATNIVYCKTCGWGGHMRTSSMQCTFNKNYVDGSYLGRKKNEKAPDNYVYQPQEKQKQKGKGQEKAKERQKGNANENENR